MSRCLTRPAYETTYPIIRTCNLLWGFALAGHKAVTVRVWTPQGCPDRAGRRDYRWPVGWRGVRPAYLQA
jgi:hypothetical protein